MVRPSSAESPRTLLQRRSEIPKSLPPLEQVLRGSLLRREIRCGKPTCHCASGTGHPILVLSVTFPGGRTRQVTVPARLASAVETWIGNYRLWWKAIEDISEINRQLLRLRQVDSATPSREGGQPRSGRSKPARDQER
jgi:hypothetical protein